MAYQDTIYCISDSVGITVKTMTRAAAAQFGSTHFGLDLLPEARDIETIKKYIDESKAKERAKGNNKPLLVFYTLAYPDLAREVDEYAKSLGDVITLDMLGNAVDAISQMSGVEPVDLPGTLREADNEYFKRVEAVEFAVAHDDGRNPQDLTKAEIVLIGVSRSSKTPLSIYLAQEGYRVANIPLDLQTNPPKQLFEVDKTRLFGLMTSPDVLIDIRRKRLGRASVIAASYADPEHVYQDLEESRKLMLKLGCKIIHTENRAVEETAREILRYYERIHGVRA